MDFEKTTYHYPDSVAPIAVIDIGSNSVRLVVYEGGKRSPSPLFNEKVLCGLGRTLATTGRLDEKGMDRALRALRRFRAIATQLGAQGPHVIATAAAREADNGPEFIAEAETICGTGISVLSGRKEAQLAALGVIAGSYRVDGLAADLGGGSLEIIDIRKQKLVGGATLPLGGLRLIDQSGNSLKEAAKLVDEALAKVDWLADGKDRPFYAVGGTWRAFARLHMAQYDYPLVVMHGYTMSPPDARNFAHLLNRLSPSSLEGVSTISKARRETVPYGALVLERLVRAVQPSRVVISAFGVREGIMYKLMSDGKRQRDPLLSGCEEMAMQRSRSPDYAIELFKWTDEIFRHSEFRETPEQRRLRQAACLLSDIEWQGHPDHRGRQSLDLIAYATFAGVDHPGRAFLALTAFYRHQGISGDDGGTRLRQLLDEDSYKRVRILSAAVRTAAMISASMAGTIPRTPLALEKDRLVLNLPGELSVLNGERLERRLAILASELDLKPEINTASSDFADYGSLPA